MGKKISDISFLGNRARKDLQRQDIIYVTS